jgi:hypothetical protein
LAASSARLHQIETGRFRNQEPDMPISAIARPKPVAKKNSAGKIVLWSIAGLLALAGSGVGIAYCCGYFGPDSRLQEVRAKNAEVLAAIKTDTTDNDQKVAKIVEARKQMEALPEGLRKTAMEEGGKLMMTMMANRAKEVLAMPPTEQTAALDKDIDFMQNMRKAFMAAQPASSSTSAGSGPPRGGPGGRPNPDSPEAKKWKNSFLSSVPAETRVQMGQYRELLAARAMQRGITMSGGPGK